MENQEQLLPGIPDELTVKEIITKVLRRESDVLARVSRGWRNAIRNHEVYEERVRSGLTETFIIAEYSGCLVVYCSRDNSFLEISGNPALARFKSIVVDGKVYILEEGLRGVGGTVSMLDLAGRRVWTQCASMQIDRGDFGCGSMDGKIYVFGGRTNDEYSCEVEMFDPKENRWSRMTPMPVSRYEPKVVALGKELVAYGGRVLREKDNQEVADRLQIYHPLKDEWRSASNPFSVCPPAPKIIFVVQGKLHSMDHFGIYIQDFDGSPCRELHSNSFLALYALRFHPHSFVVVDDEILATGVIWCVLNTFREVRFLLQRFGIEKKEMGWRQERDWLSRGAIKSMQAFQL